VYASREGQHRHHANRHPKENIPSEKAVEFSFGRLGISIFIEGRLNVERREYASDDKVHGPESKFSTRADPTNHEYDYSPPLGV